jgi:hypothetical protein
MFVDSLDLPGLSLQRREIAIRRLAARDGETWMPIPLRRVVAEKPNAH